MIKYNAVQEQNAFPPTVLHVSPLLYTLTRVGIAMLPWQICYLQHHLPTTQGRKAPYFYTSAHPSFAHLTEQPASWLCPTPDPQNRAVLVTRHRCWYKRKSCGENPTPRGRPGKSSCLAHIWLQASCSAYWSRCLQKQDHTPFCLTRFWGGGTEDPWRSFHGRHCKTSKH